MTSLITTTSSTPDAGYDWTGAIQTISGLTFHVLNPDQDMISIEDVAHALSLQCRYNGHIPSFYSVAEHSVYVARQLRDWGGNEALQLTGLLHDAAEAYVGDMVRPMKMIPELGDPFDEIETRVADAVFAKLGPKAMYPMPAFVKRADRATYVWEVANIRTGYVNGNPPEVAKGMFLNLYESLTSDA